MTTNKTFLMAALKTLEAGQARVAIKDLAETAGGTVAELAGTLKELRREGKVRLVAIGCGEGWDLPNDCIPGAEMHGQPSEWFGSVESR